MMKSRPFRPSIGDGFRVYERPPNGDEDGGDWWLDFRGGHMCARTTPLYPAPHIEVAFGFGRDKVVKLPVETSADWIKRFLELNGCELVYDEAKQ